MDDIEVYRCAKLVLGYPDPDAFLRERLEALTCDPTGTATWRRIAAAIEVLRTEKPAAGSALH